MNELIHSLNISIDLYKQFKAQYEKQAHNCQSTDPCRAEFFAAQAQIYSEVITDLEEDIKKYGKEVAL